MGGYFSPLRRKIGTVTLMLTCMFAAGWIRSFTTVDSLSIPIGNLTVEAIISEKGSLHWWELSGFVMEESLPFPTWNTANALNRRKLLDDPDINWRWRWNGWGSFEQTTVEPQIIGLVTPYSFIVMPLSLLSAWLLLLGPRNAIQTRPEPTPTSGA